MTRIRWVLLGMLLNWGSVLLGQLPPPRADIEITRNITYSTVARQPLRLDLYRPRGIAPAPVVLAVHGGSWVMQDRQQLRPLAEYLAHQGYAVLMMEYRLAPDHTYPAQLEDVRAAARWAKAHADEYALDMNNITALGVSAGAQLAALLALLPAEGVPPMQRIVACCGPMDFTGRAPNLRAEMAVKLYLGASKEERPDLYRAASPISHVMNASPPFLLIHGTDDPLVPYSQSVQMASALEKKGVTAVLHPVQHGGHTVPDITSPVGQEMMRALLVFLADASQQPRKTLSTAP